jgi:L-arabinose isomerase
MEDKIKIGMFRDWFIVSDECSANDLEQTAISSVALDRLAEKFRLRALAYYYEGEGDTDNEKIVTTLIPGMTSLTGRNLPGSANYQSF